MSESNEVTWCVFCGLKDDRYRLIGWECTICRMNGERELKYPRPRKATTLDIVLQDIKK